MKDSHVCSNKTVYGIAFVAALVCLLVYLRALSCGFVNWEDQDYVINNTAIRHLNRDFFVWAFTTMPMAFWLPLTWLSFAIDYHFWGLNPYGYHLTNILLHAANSGLVVLLADRLLQRGRWLEKVRGSGWPYYLYPLMLLCAGLVWGIHPARVESVAWVTERKDVLNGLFTIGSMLLYLQYVQNKESGAGKGTLFRAYAGAVLLFACSLMAKPTSVVLPGLLLVMDWYPLGRFRKGAVLNVLAEKVPFIALSAGLTLLTVYSGAQQNALNTFSEFPFWLRMVASGNSLFEYVRVMVYPVGILPYYDLPRAIPQVYIVKAVVVAVVLCSVIWWGKKLPWLAAVMLSFILPLVPILHITANGNQLILAPRYTYLSSLLPCLILTGMAVAAFQKVACSWPKYRQCGIAVLMAGLLVFYAAMTQRVIGFWHDSGAMWSRVIAYQPFDKAYFYRGLYYVDSGNFLAAVDDYSTCLAYALKDGNPEIYNLYAFRGEALIKAGRYEEGVQDFSAAISLFPHRLYYFHRGTALQALGKIREAGEDVARAGQAKGQIYWFSHGSSLQ
ncbi:MAG: hypothetical protein A2076_02145 [Geobacteraceae bacterium GWC2_53_11]|nr:MAG: hypothetical protein A2076_02145 [Geobacteraceae bacterium GWC2_53_11]